MIYKITFDELVWKEDFKHISKENQKLILRHLNKKLLTNPNEFGKPLSGNLKGYFSLRIMEFRVIYRIINEEIEVFVIKIGFRRNSDVYMEVVKRI